MELAVKNQLTPLRKALNYRLQELRAEVQTAAQAQHELTEDAAHEVTDRKDEAMRQQLLELDDVQARRDFNEIAQVEAALQRLDAGSFGNCAACGKPISLERLQVQPASLRCVPCQVIHEREVDRAGSQADSS